MKNPTRSFMLGLTVVLSPQLASAQTFEGVGTRATGMGGAFVAVVDDASATYWNPAALATGSYASLVLDWTTAKADIEGAPPGSGRSSAFIGFGLPMVGVSYYRLRQTSVAPPVTATVPATLAVATLVTHHVGGTFVQTVVPGLTVGATVKLVSGTASSYAAPADAFDSLLDDGGDGGDGSTRFDADLGVLVTGGRIRAGLTVRNLSEPHFDTRTGGQLGLERQFRGGVAVTVRPGWVVASDFDLLKTTTSLGEQRDLAFGSEARVIPRLVVRGGFRFNTAQNDTSGHAPSVSAGASVGLTANWYLDGQYLAELPRAHHGWGISGRFVY